MKAPPAPPLPNRRIWRLTRRNFLVWRKLMWPSLATHFAEPLVFLLGFGFGIGALVGEVNGQSYLHFLAAGIVCYGAMNGASFEALYSAFTRMHVQRTWEAVLNAPMSLDDVLLGEWLWAAIKGGMAGAAMLLVMLILGAVPAAALAGVLAVIVVTAAAFSAIALAVNAVASGYDFFSYYFTLFITPMMMLSGAFFPAEVLPPPLLAVSHALPLTAAVKLTRGMISGDMGAADMLPPLALLLAFTLAGIYIAALLTRRRLLK